MRISRVLAAGLVPVLVVLAAVLGACGTDEDGQAPAPPTEVTTSPPPSRAGTAGATASAAENAAEATAKAAVEAVFHGYYGALLARDFVAACSLVAPEAATRLLERLAEQGMPAATCEEAMGVVFARPEVAAYTDEVARSAQVQAVQVHGERATITWSATTRGQTATVSNDLRLVEGAWRLLDAN